MSQSPPKFPGFERDGKTLALWVDMKLISRDEFRKIVGDWYGLTEHFDAPVPANRMLPTPALERPSFEPEYGYFEDDEEHVYEVHTGAVFNVHTGQHVGFLEPEGVVPEDIAQLIDAAEDEEPLGPPPDDDDEEPEDDEQVSTETPE